MPRPNPLSPEEQPQPQPQSQSQGIMSPLVSESTIELSEDKKIRLKQLQQARADASGEGLMGHFTYNLLNPHLAFWQAKDEGRFTTAPWRKVPPEEAAKLQKEVPEKLSNIDNPYPPGSVNANLFDSMQKDAIESYEKGTAWGQKVRLAFPAIFEIGQLDFLMPGVAPGGATVGSHPILSNWFRSKNNLERPFNTNAQKSLLNTADIAKNPQRKEIVLELIDEHSITTNLENPTGLDFENFVVTKLKPLQIAEASGPSQSGELSTTGVDQVFESHAFSEEYMYRHKGDMSYIKNPAAIGVGYTGVHPFFYGKGGGASSDAFAHMHMIPTSIPDFGFFGHFRKVNLDEQSYIDEIKDFNNTVWDTMFVFEVQQDMTKPRKIEFPIGPKTKTFSGETQSLHPVTAPPTSLELKVYMLLNKALLNHKNIQTEIIIDEINTNPEAYAKVGIGTIDIPSVLQIASIQEGNIEKEIGRSIDDIAKSAAVPNNADRGFQSTAGIVDYMKKVSEQIYEKYYFKDGKVNPNFLEEVNSLDPYSFFSDATSAILKRDYPLTLREKIITVGGKNSDVIATSHIVEAAIRKAVEQGNQYVAFPMIDSAAKMQFWNVHGKDKLEYNKALLGNAPTFVQDFYSSGVGNKNTKQNMISLDNSDETAHLDDANFNRVVGIIETLSENKRLPLSPKLIEQGGYNLQGNVNSLGKIKSTEDKNLARSIISRMEFVQIAIKNKMPDQFNINAENIFENTIVMGKEQIQFTDFKTPKDFPRWLQISKESQEQFQNPEFLLTLFSGIDSSEDMQLEILRTVFNTNNQKEIHKKVFDILQGKLHYMDSFDKKIEEVYDKLINKQIEFTMRTDGQKIASDKDLFKSDQLKNYIAGINSTYRKKDEFRPDFLRKLDAASHPDVVIGEGRSILDFLATDVTNLSGRYTFAKNLLTNNNFLSNSLKKDMEKAWKATSYGGLVRTYTDTIPNVFKQANVETQIISIPNRAEKGKTSYVDEELSDFIQIELTPENIKKLQEYKASLFTKTILPRIKSEENEKNEKIKQYLKDNPLKPGDVI